MIGEQPSLLATRAEILAKIGACETCCNMNQLDVLPWEGSFDLVLLCHTLLGFGVRRSWLIADVYRRWHPGKRFAGYERLWRPCSRDRLGHELYLGISG
jgi:hypothetical protein